MVTIGGKTRKAKLPAQPQVVVQWDGMTNRFAQLGTDEKGQLIISWIGDPNAATKFNSKYEAKSRVRELADVPESRVFKVLERKQEAA